MQKHLLPLLGFLHRQPYTVEVILTDDGSEDKAASAEFAQNNQIKITGCQQNMGKGAMLRVGFKMATGLVQLFTDADIPFEHNNIHALILALQKDPQQLIIGDRMDAQSVYFENAPLLRNMGSSVVSGLVSRLLFKGVYDTQCGLKGMGKRVSQQLFGQTKVNRFAIDIELIYLAYKHKIPIQKMPVQLRYNDKSSVRIVSDGWQLLKDIFRVKRMHGGK